MRDKPIKVGDCVYCGNPVYDWGDSDDDIMPRDHHTSCPDYDDYV